MAFCFGISKCEGAALTAKRLSEYLNCSLGEAHVKPMLLAGNRRLISGIRQPHSENTVFQVGVLCISFNALAESN